MDVTTRLASMPETIPASMHETRNEVSLQGALSAARPEIGRLLEDALAGREIGLEAGLRLAGADGADLRALIKTADELRRQQAGERITYVVNRNINFTNVCFVGCAFCGFSRGPRAPDAYFHSRETLVAKAIEAARFGASEVCIQGGLPRDFDGYFYRDLLRAIKAALPEMHIHAYSPMEICYGVEKTGLPLGDYLEMLKQSGLGTIPGTAAEILDDQVRRELSPNKLTARQWVEIVRTAHALGIPTTSTMMYGHVEEPQHWVRHMLLLRDIQKDTRGFTEFVPLAFVHPNTRLFRRGGGRAGSTARENLVVHALARVLLGACITNLQVSWVKLGFAAALECLQAGANDFGGTLMEESISKSAGASFGECVSPAQFRTMIRSIGRIPAERTTTYGLRRVFAGQATEGEDDDAPMWRAQTSCCHETAWRPKPGAPSRTNLVAGKLTADRQQLAGHGPEPAPATLKVFSAAAGKSDAAENTHGTQAAQDSHATDGWHGPHWGSGY